MITRKIGTYGPGSVLIGNLVMLPDEAQIMAQEMIGQCLPESSKRIKNISFRKSHERGYGQIIAHAE